VIFTVSVADIIYGMLVWMGSYNQYWKSNSFGRGLEITKRRERV
jgi:hypothetical protein